MSELPTAIRDFILTVTADTRLPAYLRVDGAGRLTDWGGEAETYGLVNLQKGVDVGEQVFFLAGLLPLENSVFLPDVKTDSGMYADAYLFRDGDRKIGDETAWVLLLDATANASKRQRMQQRAYDLTFQVSDLEREGDALYQAKEELEARVRERTAELSKANEQLRQELAERRRIEAALRESESRFRRLSESNLIGIMFWDLRGRITEANDAFLDMLGYTRADLAAGKIHWEQVTRSEARSLDEKAFAEMSANGACTPFKRQFVRKDGSRVDLFFGAALLEGSTNKIVCFALDLSKYK
ncbi:MAG: PAS domain S-box protein [Acidobacteriota bacterium]|nr:PAS domain S-box protein [Acidobacteriota bacterium]